MANVQIVLVVQVVLARRKLAAAQCRNPSVVNLHEVFAEARQIPRGSRAKTLSQSNQQQQRSHSPSNPKHGEEGAKFVRPHGTQHLAEAVEKSPHNRSTNFRPAMFLLSPSKPLHLACVPR